MSKRSNRALSIVTSSAFIFAAAGLVTIHSLHPSSKLVIVEALPASSPSSTLLLFHNHLRQKPTISPSLSKSILTKLAAEKNRPPAASGNNPFQNLFGDVASTLASSLTGQQTTVTTTSSSMAALDSKIGSMISYSWDEIRSDLESKQTPDERAFRSNVEKGIGPPSPLNKIRLYDESNKEEDIRVTFYRDHASWCPYCQKVWMFLEEKRIPYRVEKINMRCYGEKPASFQRLQPSGAIPVAIIDGKVYNQSNDIIFALEQLYSGPGHKAMLPSQEETEKRMKAQELLGLERKLFSAWMYWLTGSSRSKGGFIDVLKQVENELNASQGDFFLGDEVSLVDCMFAPFLERMAASLIFFKGYQIRVAKGEKTEFPCINKWFDAMESLESYTLTKGCYYSHCWDLPPQLGGCTYEKDGEPFEKAINGERLVDGSRGSWELPLVPHLGGVEPDWDWCGDENAAKREAVERLSFNHKAIVSFASRGAGKKGFPSYSAPLSDPNAVPNEAVKGSVDACLRLVSMAMLNGLDSVSKDMDELVETLAKDGGSDHVENVIASLAYLRDRIGVPRDMRLPAARQLRGHLNYMIGKML